MTTPYTAPNAQSEELAPYSPVSQPVKPGDPFTQWELDKIEIALVILRKRINERDVLSSPNVVKQYLALRAASLDVEVFKVMYLDSQNRVIELMDMFTGTLTQTSVYPREVVKHALRLNAAAVILSHNHPSGIPTPSRADESLTQTLKAALALVDVRVLDHIIVASGNTYSFAEKGMI